MFALMKCPEYARELPFHRNARCAMDAAKAALLGQGVEIRELLPDRLHAVGRGLRSTNQSPLLGATDIAIEVHGGQLQLRAQLGGVHWMQRFIVVFPTCLTLFFLVTLAPVAIHARDGRLLWLAVLPLAPWVVLWPVLSRWLRARTERALDGLLASMLACAG